MGAGGARALPLERGAQETLIKTKQQDLNPNAEETHTIKCQRAHTLNRGKLPRDE